MANENSIFEEIISLSTEQINPNTINIDLVDTQEILKMINNEDKLVPFAVEKEIPNIAEAVETIVRVIKNGGRLIYVGAGTSGRLGVVDAAECPPTYGTDPNLVVGLIAGGRDAMFVAQEGAEDNPQGAIEDLKSIQLTCKDVVVGIAASGRTPYVRSAVNYAKSIGCKTIMISTSKRQKVLEMGINADIFITPEVGPEVIAGSTRMKSGTAQKLVLNMLTTATMVRLGKTYQNIMVDLQQTNQKLVERSKNIIMRICNVDYGKATELLEKSKGRVKNAIVMQLLNVDFEKSIELLENSEGNIRKTIAVLNTNASNQPNID